MKDKQNYTFAMIIVIWLMAFMVHPARSVSGWQRPGCHRVGEYPLWCHHSCLQVLSSTESAFHFITCAILSVTNLNLTLGHTRRIQIPGCVEFDMTTNACRGFCVSYSVPSAPETMLLNPKQITTSVGQCCNIVQSEDVSFPLFSIFFIQLLIFTCSVTFALLNFSYRRHSKYSSDIVRPSSYI